MKIFDLNSVKACGDNIVFNQDILLCDDCRALPFGSSLEKHSHTFYEIQYVFNGDGVGIYKNNSYLLHSGTVLIVSPNEVHTYYSTDNLSIANICFNPTDAQIRIIDSLKSNLLTLDENTRFEFETLYYLLKKCLSEDNKFRNRKSEAYMNLILNIISCSSVQNDILDINWNYLFFYISENYSSITLEKAANLCGRSVSSFCHIFKKKFNKTFLQYLDNIKLEKAVDLLISSDINVDAISYQVGFSHPSRFFRLFKQKFEITPHRYRAKKQK